MGLMIKVASATLSFMDRFLLWYKHKIQQMYKCFGEVARIDSRFVMKTLMKTIFFFYSSSLRSEQS